MVKQETEKLTHSFKMLKNACIHHTAIGTTTERGPELREMPFAKKKKKIYNNKRNVQHSKSKSISIYISQNQSI